MDHFKIVFSKMEKKTDQIASAIKLAIDNGCIPAGEQLPSINKFSVSYKVARDTVEKAYGILKKQGIIKSIPGKGYFVGNGKFTSDKVVVIVSNIPIYEKILYNALVQYLGDIVNIDIRLYHQDVNLLKNLIENSQLINRH
ncbi:MAG: winged helix-turn-helix domain-containing protein [Niabella sp.]